MLIIHPYQASRCVLKQVSGTPTSYHWYARVSSFHVFGYNGKIETSALMKDYGEINQWIFLYVYYFSSRGGHAE
jgi:hypothetical protein